jgi:acetolactate synthase-1/2/3 large subunit
VVLPLYDALYSSGIHHLLVRHEQAAAFAADGYARVTGKVGVCLGTSGPGATNLTTGLTSAMMDSIPIVALTGQVPLQLIGKDAFQECDTIGITMPSTKCSFLVRSAAELPGIMHQAFKTAISGRPGPVLVDLPKSVLMESALVSYPTEPGIRQLERIREWKDEEIERAAEMILESQRAVLYVGGGVIAANAWEELRELAELARIPITTTLMGLGAFPSDHPLSLGMLGMHGSYATNLAICNCDLLIGVGVRFDDRVTGRLAAFAPHAKVIHVDIDPAEIGKNVAVEIPIVGDVKRVLTALLPQVEPVSPERRAAYLAEIAGWRAESEKMPWHGSGAWRNGQLSADFVVCKIGEASSHDATIVADVGQNQMWTARYAGFRRPNSHVSSGGLGTMGFGLPAAMGAAIGRPDKETWAIVGDGGLQMTVQELMTLVQDRIPVKIALLDNHKLGMVRQWQELVYAGNYHSSHLLGPDWLKLAEAYGVAGFRASTPEEVEGAIAAARAVDGPALVHFEIAEEQNVFPMMPAGKGLSDLIEERFEEPNQ